MESKYDADGALDVLGLFAEELDPASSDQERTRAATELLESFAGLDGKAVGLHAQLGAPGKREAWISFGGRASVGLAVQGDSDTFYVRARFRPGSTGAHSQVPLVFNRRLKKFEGRELEDPAAPPGGLKRRRDALLEIALAAVDLMRKDQSPR